MNESQELGFINDAELKGIPESWGALDILKYDGLVYLRQITQRLCFQEETAIEKAKTLEEAGCAMWEDLGIRKVWTFWVVNMPLFKKIYLRYFFPYQQVRDEWQPGQLLVEDGPFLLDHVCAKLPPKKAALLRSGVGQAESGITTDEQMKCKVIDLKHFRAWITRNKQGDI